MSRIRVTVQSATGLHVAVVGVGLLGARQRLQRPPQHRHPLAALHGPARVSGRVCVLGGVGAPKRRHRPPASVGEAAPAAWAAAPPLLINWTAVHVLIHSPRSCSSGLGRCAARASLAAALCSRRLRPHRPGLAAARRLPGPAWPSRPRHGHPAAGHRPLHCPIITVARRPRAGARPSGLQALSLRVVLGGLGRASRGEPCPARTLPVRLGPRSMVPLERPIRVATRAQAV